MHGLVLLELQRFMDERYEGKSWLGNRTYLTTESYPDSEFTAIVEDAARRAGADVQAVLEQFGEFIAPTLMTVYKPYIQPEWTTLDTLEHTENHIHRAVRLHDPMAAPPRLKVRRVSFQEVVIIYESDRKLCAMAKGIARGVAKHYGERVEINELTCMLRGKPSCTIAVTKVTS
jgi:predicted hydrocarbon binding protein